MYYLIVSIVSIMIGFGLGILYYRKNVRGTEEELEWIKEELRKAKEKVGIK